MRLNYNQENAHGHNSPTILQPQTFSNVQLHGGIVVELSIWRLVVCRRPGAMGQRTRSWPSSLVGNVKTGWTQIRKASWIAYKVQPKVITRQIEASCAMQERRCLWINEVHSKGRLQHGAARYDQNAPQKGIGAIDHVSGFADHLLVLSLSTATYLSQWSMSPPVKYQAIPRTEECPRSFYYI
jgi:hypothetical protein